MQASPRTVLAAAVTLTALTALTGNASAVNLRVQVACAADYYAHCSAHSPDSPQVRSCMRAVGSGLSKTCVNALVAAGEVSAAEVAHRRGVAKTAAR
ncbi:hypothetical protein DLM45_16420 [Hyphomicrobium methylovorum]|nr:hypothetical protein [Hyphomicrobium methylovorum]